MPTQLSASDEAFMARVMDYVETHIGDADANIGDMATATATSRSGLNRKMKSLVGLTPADFLREARIKRAAHLLRTTDDAVADIAFACGFTDPKYFGKCFKATTAMSPTEYRNAPSDSHS
jgi:transcriptional regulator GlxA family with amidase domain